MSQFVVYTSVIASAFTLNNNRDKALFLIDLARFDTLTDMNCINLIHSRGSTKEAVEIAFNSASGKQGYIGPFDAYFHALALNRKIPYLTADKKHYNKTHLSIGYVTLFDDLNLAHL